MHNKTIAITNDSSCPAMVSLGFRHRDGTTIKATAVMCHLCGSWDKFQTKGDKEFIARCNWKFSDEYFNNKQRFSELLKQLRIQVQSMDEKAGEFFGGPLWKL